MTEQAQCPLVPGRAGDWCGWTRVRLSHPGAISSQRSWGLTAEFSLPLCHGKWTENKLPLHLFPAKGWTVVCTVTSDPLTSPTRVTGCAKSSYEALSGMAAVPGTEGQIPTQRALTLGRQKSRQSSRGGAQGLVPTQHTKPRKPRDVELGFYRHHTMGLWVLGRWKLQEFALGDTLSCL